MSFQKIRKFDCNDKSCSMSSQCKCEFKKKIVLKESILSKVATSSTSLQTSIFEEFCHRV